MIFLNNTSVGRSIAEYETLKVVRIPNKKIGIFFRLIQFCVIIYVVGWVMIKEKGYQLADKAVSGVTAKIKGVAYANSSIVEIGENVWDPAEFVIPPQQRDAAFIMTNLVVTPAQSLGRCDESHDVFSSQCKTDADCAKDRIVMVGSGIQTGKCVNSTKILGSGVCEIFGWCPTEYDVKAEKFLLQSAPNFTIMLKNTIEFPMYKVKRRNILHWMNKKFLKKCHYDPEDDLGKYCPIFRVDDILEHAKAEKKNLYNSGGLVSIHIEWNCDLDYDLEQCLPKYTFRHLDDFDSKVGHGWNFRFSQHYVVLGKKYRNLIKAYGIQFFITVYGKGGKFDFLTFSMNLGSGLALFGFAKQICDFLVSSISKDRRLYRKARIEYIKGLEEDPTEMKESVNKKKSKIDRDKKRVQAMSKWENFKRNHQFRDFYSESTSMDTSVNSIKFSTHDIFKRSTYEAIYNRSLSSIKRRY